MRSFLKGVEDARLRQSYVYSLLDGAMWSLMYGFAENYMTKFTVLFGATVVEMGLLQGLPQLAIGGGQLLGGYLVQHTGVSRRKLSCATVGVHALSWILAFLASWLSKSPLPGILVYCLGTFSTNMGAPGWMSWMNDLVPGKKRGAFWSWRNSILGFVQLGAIVAAAVALQAVEGGEAELPCYGVLFALAFVFRSGSVFFLSRQYHPAFEPERSGDSLSFPKFLRELPRSRFGKFAIFIVLINFTSLMLGPIIQAQLIETLRLSYFPYMMVNMASSVGVFIFMTYWGELSDRFGNRRILLVTAIGLPAVALAWVFVRPVWALVLVQLATGFVSSGFNLATTNYIFDSTPSKSLPKTVAYFNTLNTGFGFAGSLFSAYLAKFLIAGRASIGWFGPYLMIFALAALLRTVIVIVFARRIVEVRAAEPSPGLRYFYVFKPIQDLTGVFVRAGKRIREAGDRRGRGRSGPR